MVRIGRGGAIILSMSTSTTALVTVEELRRMEDPPGFRLELHNGEVVKVGSPKHQHWKIQRRIAALLTSILGDQGEAGTEFLFRARPEFELRIADVAWISAARFAAIPSDDNLQGSPEIVVEVLSPSSRAAELMEKKHLCFAAGCEQFWIVDAKRTFIEVTLADSTVHLYHGGDRIPLGPLSLAVHEIFAA